MKKIVALMVGILPCSYVVAGESTFIVGAGVNIAPVYEGSKKYQFGPNLEATYAYLSEDYGVFSLGIDGAAWGIGLTDNLTFVSSLGYDYGRDEKNGFLGNKNKDLKGMGDLDGSLLVGADLYYTLNNYAFYIMGDVATKDRHYGGRHIGRTVTVELGMNTNYEINDSWEMEYNLATVWGNKAYNQAYFGVSKQQASKSKFTEYDASSGFKDVHGSAILNYNMDENLTLYTGVAAYYLIGDAGKSSLTEQKLGFVGLTGFRYAF
ncbi:MULTISPECIES: MipA/OmpV family protein [Providencia]|uniref:MipA/OmpV family protein n=1 Tax=Providencia TaxID=586 RepID=UPI001C5B8596|nr:MULTISPECIES: MipA/OmpV family protein [Providencia]ELR5149287.1 MipA/OmpV family protein [Providencia rettgeri]QXX83709.1 MipA/OmpV family protein [Providencia sp. R33]